MKLLKKIIQFSIREDETYYYKKTEILLISFHK